MQRSNGIAWSAATLIVWTGLAIGQAFAGAPFTCLRDVEYCRYADLPLLADVYVPEGKGPFPGVLVVHGGAWLAGNKSHMAQIASSLAAEGYTAVSVNYRLAPKFLFPAQIDDCKNAVRWMRKHSDTYKLDPAHIGGFGYSAGGHLVALLATANDPAVEGSSNEPSTRLQAIVAGGAPRDFRVLPADNPRLAYWLGGTRSQKPDVYASASPLKFASADDPPALFYHGENDGLVPLISSRAMVARLKRSGVDATLLTLPGAGHIQAFRDPQPVSEAIGFFNRTLRSTARAPQEQ